MANSEESAVVSSLVLSVNNVVDLTSTDEPIKSSIDQPALDPEHEAVQGTFEGDDSDEDAWTDESLYEEALNSTGVENIADHDACTVQEALSLRKRLRLVGEDQFVIETIEAGWITAKKLCTAFGIRPPTFLEGQPDNAYYPLLGLGITRELQKRVKLPQYNSIDDAVSLLKRSRNIIVLTGAGISTSLGIPDFRSKNTGLYSQLEHLGLSDPQEVFDIHLFREDPTIFYSVAKDILPSTNRFSPTHSFIRLLQEKDKLLTNYTQNIDNLEGYAGILPEKLIQCHGSFATASCQECRYKVRGDEIYKELKAGKVAYCGRCIRRLRPDNPTGMKRKRSANGKPHSKPRRKGEYDDSSDEEDYDIAAAGVMKPDITFFGEGLPAGFRQRLEDHDQDIVDLVIVIGTSLKVAPVSEVVGFLPPNIPQMFISRDPCLHVDFDIELLGECDVVVAELCKRAGWELKHDMIPPGQEVDVKLVDGYQSRYTFRAKVA